MVFYLNYLGRRSIILKDNIIKSFNRDCNIRIIF